MAQPKEFKTNYWLWALTTAGVSLFVGLSPHVMPPKNWPHYPFGALVEMLKGDFSAETVLNGVVLPLIVVVIALPFGWILQAIIVVVWNNVAVRRRKPQNSN